MVAVVGETTTQVVVGPEDVKPTALEPAVGEEAEAVVPWCGCCCCLGCGCCCLCCWWAVTGGERTSAVSEKQMDGGGLLREEELVEEDAAASSSRQCCAPLKSSKKKSWDIKTCGFGKIQLSHSDCLCLSVTLTLL